MKSKISKILGIGLTTGLVVGLIGALFVSPVAADETKWTIVNTPNWTDLVILPGSDILDYDIGGDGDIVYAVLEVEEDCVLTTRTSSLGDFALVKSEDGGVSWSDITAKVTGAANLPTNGFSGLVAVAVAPDDEDWLAVAGYEATTGDPMVVASKDGGTNFSYTGDMMDTTTTGDATQLESIFDLAVSIEVDDIHNIAVAGESDDTDDDGTIYRLQAGTWLSAAWVDTADYLGWDDANTIGSEAVVAVIFSPNFDIDDTIVCMTLDDAYMWDVGAPFVQSGVWESTGGAYNASAGFPGAVKVTADGESLWTGAFMRSMGLSLPADYDGADPGDRTMFIYVNAWNSTTGIIGGCVFRLDNNALSPVCGPPGDPILASIDVHGDADTGKVMIGEYFVFVNDGGWQEGDPMPTPGPDWGPQDAACCEGVGVWHTEELDFCCPQWDGACKDPSGFYMALVMYTPDGEKEYCSTSGSIDEDFDDMSAETGSAGYDSWCDTYLGLSSGASTGTPLDESAFSVSRDDAVSFNQIGLIDTDIDFLMDVAVCPDCGTIYLATMSEDEGDGYGAYPCDTGTAGGECQCDSVWRSYDDGDTWERVNYGEWVDDQNTTCTGDQDELLLRLPCDAVEDCCDQDPVSPSGTVYLAIKNYDDTPADEDLRSIFYSRDCGQCWNDPPATKIDIQDMCVESENVVYVLDSDGYVSKSTQYGRRWSDEVDTGVGSGHSITCCCEQGFVAVGGNGYGKQKVGWSDDGGENWELTDQLPTGADGMVHVACDPVCENIIYAAVDDDEGCSMQNHASPGTTTGEGIYRTDITDGSWESLTALPADYTGIMMAREGTLYASTDQIAFDTVLPDQTPYMTDCMGRELIPHDLADAGDDHYSGVARNLDPCETACCGTEDWDYLTCGLTEGPGEDFDRQPSALRLCGCLTVDTNTVLYIIDTDAYDVVTDLDGALWSYEDCAAKMGPTLTSPEDDAVLDCEPCAGCDSAPFTLKWERMCNACSYDIQIMDEDGNLIIEWVDEDIVGDPPSLFMDEGLVCGETYTWKVREANTDCECIHSPWSDIWTFTIKVGAADAISLLAPEKGAMGVPIENIGFSWSGVRDATSYSFVLSPNADLTGALVSQDQSTTAFNYAGPLDYSMAYYWQVIAWKDGTRLTTSSVGVFNTMAEPVEPPPPVVVEEQPAPVINIPPAQQITPTWIYAIIGIGCALAVVVIVLIVRTRRP